MKEYLGNLDSTKIKCVYQIKYKDMTKDACYIGSTNNLKKRLNEHIYHIENETKSSQNKLYQAIKELGGECNFKIDVLYAGENHREVEETLIRTLKPSLNVTVPHRTKREYYQDNEEQTKQNKITWRYLKSDDIKQKDRDRYYDRKEYCNEKSKAYYQANKEKIKKHSSTRYTCVCGKNLTYAHKKMHIKSNNHTFRLAVFREELRNKRLEILHY